MATWKLRKQKGMHWNNMANRKCWRLLVYPHEDGENCIDIIYKLCELTSTNIKKSKIDINELLSFDTKKFLFHVRNKSRTFGYNTVITDNGLTKVKTINEKEDYKWVKIANKNDLDKLK